MERIIQQTNQLLDHVRHLVKDEIKVSVKEQENLFEELVFMLELLIHDHGAIFNNRQFPRNEFGITLTNCCGERIAYFDRSLQVFFYNVMKLIRNVNLPLGPSEFRCFIYRIRCRLCSDHREFNYVSQIVNEMKTRENRRMTVINSSKSGLLSFHAEQEHPGLVLTEVYEVNLLHDLPDNDSLPNLSNKNGLKDKRIRRAWEMFYQWVNKAMHFDGGANKC